MGGSDDDKPKGDWFRMPYRLLDAAFAARFTHRQQTTFLALVRLTLGWKGREEGDRISASQVAKMTGLARQHAAKSILELAEMNVIKREQISAQAYFIRVNVNVGEWINCHRNSDTTDTETGSVNRHQNGDSEKQTDTDLYANCHRNGVETVTETVHTIENRDLSKDKLSKAVLGSSSEKKSEKTFEQRNAEATAEAVRRRHEHLFPNNPDALDHAEAELRFKLELGHEVPNPTKYFSAIARRHVENGQRATTGKLPGVMAGHGGPISKSVDVLEWYGVEPTD